MEVQDRGVPQRSTAYPSPNRGGTSSFLLLIPFIFIAAFAWAQAPLKVEWQEARLSVHAERAPLSEILWEVARQTRATVEGAEGLTEPVSVDFTRLSVEEAFRLLLRGRSYLVVQNLHGVGSKSTVTRIVILRIGSRTQLAEDASLGPVENPAERITALGDLIGEEGMAGEAILRMAVRAGDPDVQPVALELLGYIGTPTARLAVRESTGSLNPQERISALKVLTSVDSAEALPALAQALSDADVGVKSAAIEFLASLGGSEALQLLDQTLQDPDPAIRLAVVQLLGQRGDADSITQVYKALSDPNDAVRVLANSFISRLGGGD